MNVQDQIRASLWYFPSLYENRTQALEHIFCSIGNGYEWENGQLVTDHDYEKYEKDSPHHTDPKLDFLAHVDDWLEDQLRLRRLGKGDDELSEIQVNSWRRLAEEAATRVRRNRDNIDELVETPGSLIRERGWYPSEPVEAVYPMSTKYSPLANIPDDCQPDWLDAAEEIAQVVLRINGQTSYPARTDSEKVFAAQAAKTNVLIAKAALRRIAKLR